MKAKAARLEIKRQQQAIRAKEVAREKAIHDEEVRWVPPLSSSGFSDELQLLAGYAVWPVATDHGQRRQMLSGMQSG
jgi:hypothetical protein